jgi:predicted metal-dependent enzyme (double-stranded beta helix superfamily)
MTKPDSSLTRKFLLGIIAVIIFFPIIATAKPSPLLINQKIHNLETILSHAARGKLDEAELASIQKVIEDAEAALKTGDLITAEKLYSQAWEAYQAAVKVAQTQDHKANDERHLAARTASIKALLKQLEEIDKGNEGRKTAQIENVKSLLAQTEATTDTVKALVLANQAYYTTKILLKDARNGKTLTFDHTFASPALKYADEDAYNDAHFGLLDTALEQLHAQADAEYNNHINNAKKLREQEEEEAEQNNYESGIRDLELSTIEIKKALKHIGLPVPGL